MRLIVAGGRDYKPTYADEKLLFRLFRDYKITEVVDGGAPGIDTWARQKALWMGLDAVTVWANWTKHERAAGPLRNEKMTKFADCVALFPGGVGTNSMRKIAKAHGMKIIYDAKEKT
jgi:hypothetical protein